MNFEIAFVYNIIFLFFKITRKIQSALAKIFFFIMTKPALAFAKTINTDRELHAKENLTHPFATLDLLIWHHKILWSYLQWSFRIIAYISGIKHNYNLYEHLLTWNINIPIIGYEEDKTTFTIELLGKYNERGGRSWNATWLTENKICGNFKIISKTLNATGDEVILIALWLTGSERGKIFKISNFFPFGETLSEKANHKPSNIYYPPKWLIGIMEILISASAILAFFELTKTGWQIIIPWIKTINDFVHIFIHKISSYLNIF